MFYVYQLIDPATNSPFYVGKGSGNRPKHHLYENKDNTTNMRKYNKIQKIKRANNSVEVDIIEDNLSEDAAFALEVLLIMKLGRRGIDPNGILTNIHAGGTQPIGSDNFKRNNPSIEVKGVPYTERYGIDQAAEICKKRSISLMGRTFSQTTLNQMSDSAKRRDHSYKNKKVITPDGTFESVIAVMRFYNISRPTAIKRINRFVDWKYG
jgi:hypothetical protein